MSTNNSEYLDFISTSPSQIAMIQNTSFGTISKTQRLNRMDIENTRFLTLAGKGGKRILKMNYLGQQAKPNNFFGY